MPCEIIHTVKANADSGLTVVAGALSTEGAKSRKNQRNG
jgi:hypothetical protein